MSSARRTAAGRRSPRRPPLRPRGAPPWTALAAAALLGACGTPGESAAPAAADDLAAACEAAVEAAPAAAERPLAWEIAPAGLVGDEDENPLGRIIGAVWHPGRERLYVLDAYAGGVQVYDSAGTWLRSFGRTGGGPGEFAELGGWHGARAVFNQMARLGDGHLAVLEPGLLHVFDADGGFVQRIRTDLGSDGPFGVLHVAGISDSAVLFSRTGAVQAAPDDRDARTSLRLLAARLAGSEIDTAAFGRLRNNLNRFPPVDGPPPSDPYLRFYRRTWDAIPSGVIAASSQRRPGVCFFDAGGRLLAAHRVDAEPIPVDRAERERVLQRFRERGGPRAPMIDRPWEEVYDTWPETVPPYADLALAPDSVAWLLRPLRGGGTTLDVYHAARGYLGSREPFGERLPLAFSPRCAYVIEERVPETEREGRAFYGLRRWCWTEPEAAAPADRPTRGDDR